MIRPALMLPAAAAVGGRSEGALPAAVAVEFVHSFSVLHVDVMDRGRFRHHRSTMGAVFGVLTAVLAGGVLLALGVLRGVRKCGRRPVLVSSVAVDFFWLPAQTGQRRTR